ncbi:MAG: hypothetical protein QXI97_02720 [Nitrososphaerota archaeon]
MRNITLLISLILLILTQPAHALDSPPPGTPYGITYVRVTDCSTGEPVVGASVTLENPSHTASGATNNTGYAVLEGYDWFYAYYVSTSGYRIAHGERRFTPGSIFSVCLVRETAGFWRVVSTVSMWQGDTHAGGLGWAIIRLKNLEPGYFEIHSLEIWVSGYEGAVAAAEYGGLEKLGRDVEKEFNITIAPPPDVPVGRLAAQLRMRATFTYDDGRTIGPLTIITSLDYVEILPYRSFSFRILDFWGLNPVPNATIVMESTLPGASAQHVLHADSQGNVAVRRLRDGVYWVLIYYSSPYDDERYVVKSYFPLLVDLARYGGVKTHLYEARVDVVDLSGRNLNTTVSLGRVAAESVDGVAMFKNVPRGLYRVRAWWKGVEVFNGSINVDEPFSSPSPGGYVKAVADVGDLILVLGDAGGGELAENVTLTLEPDGVSISSHNAISFTQLPRGEYTITAAKYNWVTRELAKVGRFTFKIPEDHGEHRLRLEIYDVVLSFTDAAGKPAPLDRVEVGEAVLVPEGGRIAFDEVSRGPYHVRAEWLGSTVFDDVIILPDVSVVRAAIYPLTLRVETADGERLSTGLAVLSIGVAAFESKIVDGLANFTSVPQGLHRLKITLDGVLVYDEALYVKNGMADVTVGAGRLRVRVLDQNGSPVKSAWVEVGRLSAETDEMGVADLGQLPTVQYSYIVKYRGLAAASGLVRPGGTSDVRVEIYRLRVAVVNQLGQPVEAEVEVSADGKHLDRAYGFAVLFPDLPKGVYTVRVSYGAKQVLEDIEVTSAVQDIMVTLPYALELGPRITLSITDLWTIATPIALVVTALAVILAAGKTFRRASAKRRGLSGI